MKNIVYVHGATRHPQGYSKPWFASLKPYLDRNETYQVHEVNYGDIVSPWVPEWLAAKRISLYRWLFGYGEWVVPFGIELIDDAVLWERYRRRVIDRVLETLLPLLGRDTTVICHSLGGLVMPEVLWHLEATDFPLELSRLIIWGTPLDRPVAEIIMMTDKPEGWVIHRPTNVDRIAVLGIRCDHFRGPWRMLEVPGRDVENIDISPRVDSWRSICCHSDGFSPYNLEAQQIQAKFIDEPIYR